MRKRLAPLLIAVLLVTELFAQTKAYAPELFSENVSAGVCGFSPDGKTIYFVRMDTTRNKLLLYEAEWSSHSWVNTRLMPFSGEHNDFGGRISPDGKTFFFTSDRPGASANVGDGWNIWKVTRGESGWQGPEPLGAISSKGEECCPTPFNGTILFSGTRGKDQWKILQLQVDGAEVLSGGLNEPGWQWPSYYDPASGLLFFNSMKRKDSRGMDDIYIARMVNGTWTDVRNLGDSVNTGEYEDGAIPTPDRTLLIFNRHNPGNHKSKVLSIELEGLMRSINVKWKQ